ncbi:MAG: hypothetical protein NW201_13780 [Gemmatimonadales bacterium]|nr:hypothetical protein [Gemmatimonadales bacterium]
MTARRWAAAWAVLGIATAAPLVAQNPGIPVYNSGVPRGLGLYASFAKPLTDAGGGQAVAASGRLGLGRLGVTATLAYWDPASQRLGNLVTGDGSFSAGATANYRFFGGPLVPFSATFQVGAAFQQADEIRAGPGVAAFIASTDRVRVPIGLGIGYTIPGAVVAVRPWVAPRLELRGVRAPLATQPGQQAWSWGGSFGVSGGVELNFLNGFGLHAAVDFPRLDTRVSDAILSAGAHYLIKLPGL